MKTGWRISIALHAILIGMALFAVPYDEDRDRDVARVTEVSLISMDALMAERDQAPELRTAPTPQMRPPSFEQDAGGAPAADAAPEETAQAPIAEPSERDAQADLTALLEQAAQPEVVTSVDAPAESAPQPPAATLALPGDSGLDNRTEAPQGPARTTPPAPRQAPVIGSFEAPAPARPAEPAERPTPPTVETPSEVAAAEPPPEPPQEQAPAEQTTAPSPDPASGAEEGIALRRSTAPRARPRNFEEQLIAEAVALAAAEAAAEAPRETPPAPAQTAQSAPTPPAEAPPRPEQTAAAEPAPAPAPAPTPAPAEVPVGPPLTAGERDALRLAVQRCWNIPAGLENASDLRVVIAADLDPDGRISGPIRLIEPANSSRSEIQIAFEAARRALLRCQGEGYDLPREKYQQWRNLEVAFDPRGMLLRW